MNRPPSWNEWRDSWREWRKFAKQHPELFQPEDEGHGPFGEHRPFDHSEPFGRHGPFGEHRHFEWPHRGHHGPWPHQHGPFPDGPTPWVVRGPFWKRRQRGLFWRFAATFGAVMLLGVGGMAILALVLTRMVNGNGQVALLTWIGGCGLALVLPVLGIGVAVAASRTITSPLTDVMAAADAVASGDLDVRVPENAGSEFGKLARTFNHMVDELKRSDEARRNLTADVAHELRTPLHVIQGNLEGILDGVYQPTPEHIQMLLEETQLLSRLVEDLRTLSLAESGHLPLHKEQVQVRDLLSDMATSFSSQAQAAGINLRVETSKLSATTISADVMRMNQVLANLIVNALRYTPAGGSITLGGEPTNDGVRLTVCDTGQGIPAEDLPHVFDRFWRGDPARSHRDGVGGGLGLAIVKQLVELHGGNVSVQSAVTKGTTFTIELPVPPPES